MSKKLLQSPSAEKHFWSFSKPDKIRYNCARCSRDFQTKSHLSKHLLFMHNFSQYIKDGKVFTYECDFCGYQTGYQSAFKRHCIMKHSQRPGLFKCLKCPKTFKGRWALTTHLKTEHSKGQQFKCNDCGKTFKKACSLRQHSVFHKAPQISCDCGQKFFNSSGFGFHYKALHLGENRDNKSYSDATFSCDKCQMKFSSSQSLLKHSRWHMPRKFKCSKCFGAFMTVGELKIHQQSAHSNVAAVNKKRTSAVTCARCSRGFQTKSYLSRHLLLNACALKRPSQFHGIPKYGCSQCDFKYYTSYKLANHWRRVHTIRYDMPTYIPTDQQTFFCSICCRPFGDQKPALTYHLATHYKISNICEKCQKSFNSERDLNNHRNQVHKIYKCSTCVCDICNKSFRSASNLRMHRQFHGKPQLSCSECSVKFYLRSNLVQHAISNHNSASMTKTLGKGPFGCAICTRRFRSRDELKGHHVSHKPADFPCPNCHYVARKKQTITKHLKLFHGFYGR